MRSRFAAIEHHQKLDQADGRRVTRPRAAKLTMPFQATRVSDRWFESASLLRGVRLGSELRGCRRKAWRFCASLHGKRDERGGRAGGTPAHLAVSLRRALMQSHLEGSRRSKQHPAAPRSRPGMLRRLSRIIDRGLAQKTQAVDRMT